MTRLVLLLATLVAGGALAADTAEDKERKAEAAAVKACQVAKDKMSTQEACSEEYGHMSAVICSDKESRSTVDYVKLNAECQKKLKRLPAKKGAAKKK